MKNAIGWILYIAQMAVIAVALGLAYRHLDQIIAWALYAQACAGQPIAYNAPCRPMWMVVIYLTAGFALFIALTIAIHYASYRYKWQRALIEQAKRDMVNTAAIEELKAPWDGDPDAARRYERIKAGA